MDGYIGRIIRSKDGKTTLKRAAEELPALWQAIQQKTVRQQVGRLFKVSETEVLLSVLRELMERARQQGRLSEPGAETQETELRTVWDSLEIGCTSQERRHNEQRARELTNIVPQLSYETALAFTQAWHDFWRSFSHIYGEALELDGFKLSKSAHRKEQLKAYGNAIVPAVAVEIMKGMAS